MIKFLDVGRRSLKARARGDANHLHKLLRLINFRPEVRTPASIGMVSNHKVSMFLAYRLFARASFTPTKASLAFTLGTRQQSAHT